MVKNTNFIVEERFRRLFVGLSLVKKIIKGYSGKIWIEDKVVNDYTKGSNFIVLIPQTYHKLVNK
ncbi:MAG: hypothetical protein ACFFG0_26160 [Candidatus Thorarchaeota archaeon]